MSDPGVRRPTSFPRLASALPGRATIPSLLTLSAIIVAAAFTLRSAPTSASAPAPAVEAASGLARRCVGVFVTGDRRSVAADAKSLTVVGTIPCADRGVSAWAMQGVYRAFEDGSVEFLASPVPPCPGGDSYVWIRYPNPG